MRDAMGEPLRKRRGADMCHPRRSAFANASLKAVRTGQTSGEAQGSSARPRAAGESLGAGQICREIQRLCARLGDLMAMKGDPR
jgi:hypothetical protein